MTIRRSCLMLSRPRVTALCFATMVIGSGKTHPATEPMLTELGGSRAVGACPPSLFALIVRLRLLKKPAPKEPAGRRHDDDDDDRP